MSALLPSSKSVLECPRSTRVPSREEANILTERPLSIRDQYSYPIVYLTVHSIHVINRRSMWSSATTLRRSMPKWISCLALAVAPISPHLPYLESPLTSSPCQYCWGDKERFSPEIITAVYDQYIADCCYLIVW